MDLKNTCDHCSFVAQSEVRECYSSSSGFLFQGCFGYSGLLCFDTNFNFFGSYSVKTDKTEIVIDVEKKLLVTRV